MLVINHPRTPEKRDLIATPSHFHFRLYEKPGISEPQYRFGDVDQGAPVG